MDINQEMKYLYFKSDKNPNKVTTVGYVEVAKFGFDWVIAKCNGQDRFSRKIGREICKGRIIKENTPNMKAGFFSGNWRGFILEMIADHHPDAQQRRIAREAQFREMTDAPVVAEALDDVPF